jgi:hypothetical protein
LVESQDKSFVLFYQFASTTIRENWDRLVDGKTQKEFLCSRDKLISAKPKTKTFAQLGVDWFNISSRRLNAISDIESNLILEMKEEIQTLILEAESELERVEKEFEIIQSSESIDFPHDVLFNRKIPLQSPYYFSGHNSSHSYPVESLFSLLQQQSQRIAEMDIELLEVKKTLSDRKLLDQAKGLLMNKLSISEAEAYKQIRSTAMDQNRTISDIAENILKKFRS